MSKKNTKVLKSVDFSHNELKQAYLDQRRATQQARLIQWEGENYT